MTDNEALNALAGTQKLTDNECLNLLALQGGIDIDGGDASGETPQP
jgi:hypothetical protein